MVANIPMAANDDLVDKESAISEDVPGEPTADEDSHQIYSGTNEKTGPSQDDLNVSAEPPSEQAPQAVATPGEDYSVLTVNQKRMIVMTGSIASIFSPMATSIYCKSRPPPHLWPQDMSN